jgi:hypothetical protein
LRYDAESLISVFRLSDHINIVDKLQQGLNLCFAIIASVAIALHCNAFIAVM